jgi:DNA repair exonuclease SbcCD ATPase subunit
MMKGITILPTELKTYIYASFTLLIFVGLFHQYAHADQSKKILKWTDEKGVVHYGDVLPTKAVGRSNAELNQSGIVVKKNQEYSSKNQEESLVNTEQVRKDSALLASYSSIQEIDLALKRNLSSEENFLTGLMQSFEDTQTVLNKKRALKEKLQSNQQVVPSYLDDEIQANQKRIGYLDAEIKRKKQAIVEITQRFNNYKVRYAELRPRNNALSEINVGKRNLSELENWKKSANRKLNNYLDETVTYKRAGKSVPQDIVLGIQQATQEIARADEEIAAIRASIVNSQETFSSK